MTTQTHTMAAAPIAPYRPHKRSSLTLPIAAAAALIVILGGATGLLLLQNGALRSQVATLSTAIDAAAPSASAQAIAAADRIAALEAQVARLQAAAANSSAQTAAAAAAPATHRDGRRLVTQEDFEKLRGDETYKETCAALGVQGVLIEQNNNVTVGYVLMVYRWPGNGGEGSYIEAAFQPQMKYKVQHRLK